MKRNDSHHHRVYTPTEIGDWVRRYRSSGLGLVAFAEEHGLPRSRLHYWVYDKRFADLAQPVMREPIFQEIKLTAGLPGAPWAVEISLPGGPVARFGTGAGPAWIGEVMAALRRPC